MDIPSGLIGLVGILTIPLWLVAECRGSRRTIRIVLAIWCAALIAVALSHTNSAALYLNKEFLRKIDHQLADGDPSKVRRAIARYDRAYQSTHDFADAAIAGSASLEEGVKNVE